MLYFKRLVKFLCCCAAVTECLNWVSDSVTSQPSDFITTFVYVCIWASLLKLLVRKLLPKKPKYNAWRLQ